jgi:hypothetical protein
MAGWDSDEKKGLRHCPFLMTKISKGCQNGEWDGMIRDRNMSITE